VRRPVEIALLGLCHVELPESVLNAAFRNVFEREVAGSNGHAFISDSLRIEFTRRTGIAMPDTKRLVDVFAEVVQLLK
jgi:hypothetical protein